MKIVIVGGVAAGATAAARIRRLDENAEIIVFERTGYISYANCGLPYYIGDVITDPEELTLQTPESFYERFRVSMKVRHEVTAIHPERKTVSVKDLESNAEWEESYDKLVLSTGAKPVVPKLQGVGLEKVFTLRTVEDILRIKEFVEKGKLVYVICQSGLRSYIASRILEGNGYEAYNFAGGYRFYDVVKNDRCLIEKEKACGMDA